MRAKRMTRTPGRSEGEDDDKESGCEQDDEMGDEENQNCLADGKWLKASEKGSWIDVTQNAGAERSEACL